MKSRKISRSTASAIALNLREAFAGACDRIEVAGSVRRFEAYVGDIEMVAQPRILEEVAQLALFEAAESGRVFTLALWDRIAELNDLSRAADLGDAIVPLKPTSKVRWNGAAAVVEEDPKWASKRSAVTPEGLPRMLKLWLPRTGVKVDLFLATPARWGVCVAIRTGSRDFSAALVRRWTEVSGGGRCSENLLHRPFTAGGLTFGFHASDGAPLGPPIATPEEEDVFEACRIAWKRPQERRSGRDCIPVDQRDRREEAAS